MEEEGVTKFQLCFTAGPPVQMNVISELNKWRSILWERGLIGQDPARYAGYAFGNVSQRIASRSAAIGKREFIISGTQTGHLERLTCSHYVRVSAYKTATNQVVANGPVRPSSETLTHGAIYDLDNELRAVLHVHSSDIWMSAASNNIPITRASIEYGTPEMSREVARLFSETTVREQGIFSMGGHKDGIVAFGTSVEEAGNRLITALQCSNMR